MQHDLACGCFLAIHARNGPVEWAQFTSASCCFEPHPGASSRVLRPSRQKSPRPASFRPSAALSRERTTNQELLLLIAQRTPATGPRAALCRGSVRENRLLIEATEAAQLLILRNQRPETFFLVRAPAPREGTAESLTRRTILGKGASGRGSFCRGARTKLENLDVRATRAPTRPRSFPGRRAPSAGKSQIE